MIGHFFVRLRAALHPRCPLIYELRFWYLNLLSNANQMKGMIHLFTRRELTGGSEEARKGYTAIYTSFLCAQELEGLVGHHTVDQEFFYLDSSGLKC